VPTVTAPRRPSGVAPDDSRQTVYLIAVGLVVLLLAIVVVAATTLTGSTPATEAEQVRAAKLSKLPVYWTVHTGDTYARIAQKTGLTVVELEAFNRLVDPSTIRPGQRLKLRLHVPKAKPKPLGPRFHTLRRGESFGSIAAQRGVPIFRLQELNPKLKATALQPGARVRLRK
jgi:LysM repeat protein